MITETGKNLSILITTQPGMDWQAFSTWYSAFKNAPDAKIVMTCQRNEESPFRLYQWAKKVNLPVIHHSPFSDDEILNKLNAIEISGIKENLLVLDPLVTITETLDTKITKEDSLGGDAWYLRKPQAKELMNTYALKGEEILKERNICVEAKESDEPFCLVSYKKGCGKWIDTSKGCPFSSATGLSLTETTINENRIIELWKRMCTLFGVLV